MGIYRGVGGTGDSSIGQDIQGSNSTITDLIGIQGPIRKPTYIEFDQAANITPTAGQVSWNGTEGTLDVGLNGGTVVLQVGEETLYRVSNFSGETIPNGSLVCYAGTTGNSGKLKVALWDGSQPANTILGLTTDNIEQGGVGFVTHFGKVRGIQTNGGNYGETWVDGDILYADPAGGLTKVKPEAPDTKTTVAVVIRAHGSNGTFFVRPQISSNLNDDDLVELTSLANGDILKYNSTSGRFENEELTIALGTETTGNYVASMTAGTGISVGTATGEGSTPVITNTAPDQVVELIEGTGVTITGTYPSFTINAEGGSGGVSDGDKGDIVVSSSGAVWTIDSDVVSYSKIQNVSATDKILGRVSSGAGDIEEITCTSAGRALLDDADASAQRTTLGLGTAATTDSTAYATAAQGALADSALQSSAIGVTIQGYDATLLNEADIGTTVQAYDATTTKNTATQTLTNKTISGSNNTLSNIGNSSLTNSAITINGTSVSLGGSISTGYSDIQTFTSSGTWTKPSGGSYALIRVWGAGGGGGRRGENDDVSGGGGGGYSEVIYPLASLSSTATVTIGAGGAGRSTSGNGTSGGNSTFVSGAFTVTGYGGGGGGNNTLLVYGGGSGGALNAGGIGGTSIPVRGLPLYGHWSGGDGGASRSNSLGDNRSCVFGGAGGGGRDGADDTTYLAGGTSLYGGNGGAASRNATAGNGVQPGGGGGASAGGTSGDGAAGKVEVLVW